MSVSRIRGFLITLPKPAVVRVSGDGEPQEIKPGRSYAKCAESIEALGPDLIECLDAEGRVLRAMRLGTTESRRSDAAEIPVALQADPHALMLTHFANLIHRAYEHSTELAFVKLVELTDKMNDRAEGIEARLERAEAANRRLTAEQIEDAYAHAEEIAANNGQGGFGDAMLQAFMGGQATGGVPGAVPPQPQPRSNGKGKHS